jgi:hypothetical protein
LTPTRDTGVDEIEVQLEGTLVAKQHKFEIRRLANQSGGADLAIAPWAPLANSSKTIAESFSDAIPAPSGPGRVTWVASRPLTWAMSPTYKRAHIDHV